MRPGQNNHYLSSLTVIGIFEVTKTGKGKRIESVSHVALEQGKSAVLAVSRRQTLSEESIHAVLGQIIAPLKQGQQNREIATCGFKLMLKWVD
jgi:hypothetical protein